MTTSRERERGEKRQTGMVSWGEQVETRQHRQATEGKEQWREDSGYAAMRR